MSTAIRRRTPLVLVTLATISLTAASAALGQGQVGDRPIGQSPGQARPQPQAQTTLQGRIDSVRQVYLPQAPTGHTIIEVRLQDGHTHYVDLGAQADFNRFDLEPGQSIVVRGNLTRLGREQVLSARTFSVDGQPYALRGAGVDRGDQIGRPIGQPQPRTEPARQQPQQDWWFQDQETVQGRVDNLRQVNLPGAPPQHTIIEVRFQDGRTELVNLGRAADLRQLNLRPGDQLLITGEEHSIANQPVITASSVSINGRQLDLGWREQPPGRWQPPGRGQQPQQQVPEQIQWVIGNWPQASQQAARETISTYGPPEEFTRSMLIWYNNNPWVRTIVHSDPAPHNFPMPHEDVLQQTINLDVPFERYADLARFDGSILINRTRGEVTSQCDSEAMNFATLNLAYQIINGEIDVQQARQQLARIASAHAQGQAHPYTQGLQFTPPARDTGDPDQRVQPGGQIRPIRR